VYFCLRPLYRSLVSLFFLQSSILGKVFVGTSILLSYSFPPMLGSPTILIFCCYPQQRVRPYRLPLIREPLDSFSLMMLSHPRGQEAWNLSLKLMFLVLSCRKAKFTRSLLRLVFSLLQYWLKAPPAFASSRTAVLERGLTESGLLAVLPPRL